MSEQSGKPRTSGWGAVTSPFIYIPVARFPGVHRVDTVADMKSAHLNLIKIAQSVKAISDDALEAGFEMAMELARL